MKRALRQLSIICLLALAPALLAAWLHPKRPLPRASDGVLLITASQASTLALDQSVLWIDARSEVAFKAGHIPGARRLTLQEWESLLPGVVGAWSPADQIIVYCDHQTCDASAHVGARLRLELQLERVHVLEGGWEAWNRSLKD